VPNDAYSDVRTLPLSAVLVFLGVSTEWRTRKGGLEQYGPCPICKPKKNQTNFSFHVDGRFGCFSCTAHGRGAIDITMKVRGISFREAVELLQSQTGNIIAQAAAKPAIKQLLKSPQDSANVSGKLSDDSIKQTLNPPFKSTYEKFAVESAWLKERGFESRTMQHFEVFEYNNPARKSVYSGSVMLKIRRWSDSECVGYLSRNIGEATAERPKYVFPKGFQKSLELFGAFQLKEKAPVRVLYVVESPFAVMKFYQHGFEAVSCFGWSVSPAQAGILAGLSKGCIFLPDRNKTQDAIPIAGLLSQYLWVKMPELPDGVDDPEQLSIEQIHALTWSGLFYLLLKRESYLQFSNHTEVVK